MKYSKFKDFSVKKKYPSRFSLLMYKIFTTI